MKVTDADFESRQHLFCAGLDQLQAASGDDRVHAEATMSVLGWDDGLHMRFAGITAAGVEDPAELVTGKRVLAMATRVAWARTDDEPTTDAWLAVIVSRDHYQAAYYVKRHVEDVRWWQLGADQVPWVALSTAAGLRGVLAGQPWPPLKSSSDGRLLRRPDEEPAPPVDENGLL